LCVAIRNYTVIIVLLVYYMHKAAHVQGDPKLAHFFVAYALTSSIFKLISLLKSVEYL